ncbi:MAG TPA: Crp/Fnr family transcriptional regulator [Polyangiaceae bacterium]|nr:Crp/Fnr family transcriptional regulator [Polyangiaceae bacterium]
MPEEITHREQIAALRQLLGRIAGEPIPHFDEFTALFRPRSLDRGAFLVRAGETSEAVAFVSSGVARMFYTRRDGKEFNKGFVSPPDFVSALEALITKMPTTLSIQALSPMQLLVASYGELSRFYDRDIYWQRAGRLIVERVYVKKARREASLLMDSAAERYADFLAEHHAALDQVADYHIAAYLGITPEALSRLRRARAKPCGR